MYIIDLDLGSGDHIPVSTESLPLAQGEWIKFNRLGEALMLAVPVSPLHATVVNDALQRLLPLLDLQQKNLFHLLEVVLETQAMTRLPLSDTARSALGTVGGSGKAAKIAKELLAKGLLSIA